MKIRKKVPFEFVLEALDAVPIHTRAMFGCTAVYLEDRIMLVLRCKDDHPRDNGVWLGTSVEYHDSLRKLFPMMRSIEFLGAPPTNWQNIPESDPRFEAAVLRACELILSGDPRIGRVPKPRKPKRKRPKKGA